MVSTYNLILAIQFMLLILERLGIQNQGQAFPILRLKKGLMIGDDYLIELSMKTNQYLNDFTHAGLIPSGKNSKKDLVEIVELKGHPFFIGVQYHPELKSTVANPHPLFVGLIAASLAIKNSK